MLLQEERSTLATHGSYILHHYHSHVPGELGGVPGEGVAGVVGELAAAAQGEGLDVRAVAGEDQEGVVTNILHNDSNE